MPVLGKQQFKVAAARSKEFDRYLETTLGGHDNALALRKRLRNDRWRDDDKPSIDSSRVKTKAASSRPKTEPFIVTDSESDNGSYSESGNDNSDSEIMERASNSQFSTRTDVDVDATQELAEYEEFLKFKAMKQKARKR